MFGLTVRTYDELFYTSKIKNSSMESNFITPEEGQLGVDFSAIHERERITYVYIVQKLPQKLPLEYRKRLRHACIEDTKMHFIDYCRPHTIDWDSHHMKGKLRVLEQVAKENNEKDRNAYNHHTNTDKFSRQKRIEESLVYLSEAEKDHERLLLKKSSLVLITGTRGKYFDESVMEFEREAKTLGIGLWRVMFNIPEIIRYFSPFVMENSFKAGKFIPTSVLTDEIAARSYAYEQGIIGRVGIIVGNDINNDRIVAKKFKLTSESAETVVITAETGGGKSNLVKELLIQLLGQSQYIATIMDIEGFEYIPLYNFIKNDYQAELINLAEGTGNYLDPVEIPPLTGIEDIDSDLFKFSKDFTVAVFTTIAGSAVDTDDFVLSYIKKAVGTFYKEMLGVDAYDNATWKRSRGYTLHDVYKVIKNMLQESIEEKHIHEKRLALEKLVGALSDYFEPTGSSADIFVKPISIANIITAKLVVCSFGMAGKSPSSIDRIRLALMQLFAANISHQRSIFAKAQGLFNIKLWEEFQRWGDFPNSENTIGVAVTGGRKLGDINIIITNDVRKLLENDRFSVLVNWSSMFIGAIADENVREQLCRRISYPQMKPEVDKITAAAKKEEDLSEEEKLRIIAGGTGENRYTYSFLTILDRSSVSVTKMVMQKEVVQSALFRTGVDTSKRTLESRQ